MRIHLFCFLIFVFTNAFGTDYFQKIEPRFDVSPPQMEYSALAMGVVSLGLVIASPNTNRPLIYLPEIDKRHNFDIPKWAYNLGDKGAQYILAVPYLYYLGMRPSYAWEKMFVYTETLLFMNSAVTITKYSVGRKRPTGNNLSFPSGHTAQSFSTATWIATDLWRTTTGPIKYVSVVVPYAFASFVGATRIGGKKHYFTDVVAGAAIGSSISYIMYNFHFDAKGNLRNQNFPTVNFLYEPSDSSSMLLMSYRF